MKKAKLIGKKQWKYFLLWLHESTFRSEPPIGTIREWPEWSVWREQMIERCKQETP